LTAGLYRIGEKGNPFYMDLIAIYKRVWALISWDYFVLAGVTFLLGVTSAPLVVKRNIRLLIKFPYWIFQTIQRYIRHEHNIRSLFILIFALNTFSLSIDFLAGWGILLPLVFCFLTGLNVSIISFKLGGHTGILALFLNPVALIELPAAWFAISIGMKLGVTIYQSGYSQQALNIFYQGIDIFVFLVIPLLALAAFLEAVLIQLIQNNSNSNLSNTEDKFDL